jgi:hypothetical protein
MFSSFADVIDQWPSFAALSRDVGVPPVTARFWRYRNSIPAKQWHLVIDAARERGIEGVTLEVLADLASRPPVLLPLSGGNGREKSVKST